MLAHWLKEHFNWVWRLVFVGSTLPAASLAVQYFGDGLGPNPLAQLLHTTGLSALVLLAITLAVTPLRRWATLVSKAVHLQFGKRLADWNWLIRLRRPLGLWCFFYALVHASIYLSLDLGFDWSAGWEEALEKPYLLAGLASLLLLLPLAITSAPRMMKLLGKNWRRLHMLTYLVAVLCLLHFWWMQKPGVWRPMPYSVVIGGLLAYRVLVRSGIWRRWDGDDGRESAERSAGSPKTGV